MFPVNSKKIVNTLADQFVHTILLLAQKMSERKRTETPSNSASKTYKK